MEGFLEFVCVCVCVCVCCFFFNFMFSVEVFQVELTGFPDRAHSGSALSTVQAVMLEKSRGGRST